MIVIQCVEKESNLQIAAVYHKLRVGIRHLICYCQFLVPFLLFFGPNLLVYLDSSAFSQLEANATKHMKSAVTVESTADRPIGRVSHGCLLLAPGWAWPIAQPGCRASPDLLNPIRPAVREGGLAPSGVSNTRGTSGASGASARPVSNK
jgi:hypothetical protein